MGLIVRASGLLVRTFYHHVRLGGGGVPQDGPVLVVANHTHQLVDVALALHAIERPTVLLAKATLFDTPVLSWFVRRVHALPVHRARDGERDAAAKRETARSLATAETVLAEGGCMLVFPEGFSHDEPGVHPAHSGAARIALGAVGRGARDLRIVPLGLLYRAKGRPRSEAATLVGTAVEWRDLVPHDVEAHDVEARDVDAHDLEERAAVDALTARIEAALRDVTLHLDEWEDLPLVQAATAIGGALEGGDEARALALLSEGIARMRAHQPATLARTRRRVAVHASRLQRAGVRPDEHAPPAQRAALAALRVGAGVVIAPLLALAGLLARRPALVRRARGSVHAAIAFLGLIARGRFSRGVDAERRALLREIDALLRAARALPPAPDTSSQCARLTDASVTRP